MAQGRIAGLTVEIAGETTKLTSALKGVRSDAANVNTELRTIDKLLKFEAADQVDLLARRLDTAEKAAAEVKKEINLLNKGLEENEKAFKDSDPATYEKNLASLSKQLTTANGKYEVLQAELGDTAKRLDEAKSGVDKNTQSLRKMGEETDAAGDKSVSFGQKLKENLANQTVGNGLRQLGVNINDIDSGMVSAGGSAISLGSLIGANLISTAVIGGLQTVANLFKSIVNLAKSAAKAGVEYVKDARDMAADYEDALGYSEQVYGEYSENVQNFVDDNTIALRSNKAELLENINTFGSLFNAAGIGKQTSYEYSASLVKLASDMRAATGNELSQVILNLQSVMTGGAQAGYKYGLVIQENAVKAKALQMGLVQTSVDMSDVNAASLKLEKNQKELAKAVREHGEESLEYRSALQKVNEAEKALDTAMEGKGIALTEAQKQEARYALIMEQSVAMQDQATREAGNYKSQMDLVNTVFDNLKISIGEKVLPVFTELITKFNEFIQSAEGQEIIDNIIGNVGTAADKVLEFVRSGDLKEFADRWVPRVSAFVNEMVNNLPGVIGSIGTIINKIMDLISWFERVDYATMTDEEKREFAMQEFEKYADGLGLTHKQMADAIGLTAQTYGANLETILENYYNYESIVKGTMDNVQAHMDGSFAKQDESFQTNLDSVKAYAEHLGLDYDEALEAIGFYAQKHKLNVAEMLGDWDKYKDDSIAAMELAVTGMDDWVRDQSSNLETGKKTAKEKTEDISGSMKTMAENVKTEGENAAAAMQSGVDKMAQVNTEPYMQKVNLIQALAGGLKETWLWLTGQESSLTSQSQQTKIPGRASGGPVVAGKLYRVNEQGIEIFRPAVNGTILSAPQTQAVLAGAGGQQASAGGNQTAPSPFTQSEQSQFIDITIPITAMLDSNVIYQGQKKVRFSYGKSLFEGGSSG